MKNILCFVFLFAILLLTGCKKNWDNHYGEEGSVSELDLLAYLKSQPQYSEFVLKLEETGLADELQRDQNLTIWAVSNDKMSALQSLGTDLKFILSYHINSLVYDHTKLKNGLRVMTFNGKYLTITKEGPTVYVGDASVIKGNQLCKNGVVHEITQLLKPDESIYDYLLSLGADYSMIRDSIRAMNDTVFDLANSIPIGVDATGNTVYDSVFVIANPIFDKANIRSEFANVTMFLPSNRVIEDCFDDLAELYGQFGKSFLKEDTLIAYQWIKEAIFYDKVVDNYGESDLTSAFGRLWKPTVQRINTDYKRMSNGRVYQVTKLKIPNNVHIQMIKQLFHYYEFVPDDQRDALFKLSHVTNIEPKDRDKVSFPTIGVELTYRTLLFQGNLTDNQPATLEFTPIMLERKGDGSTGYKVVEVPPGEYNLYMGFRSSAHPFVNIYVDDQPVARALNVEPSTPWNYDRSTNTVSGTKYNGWGGLVGPVTIEGSEVRSFKLKIEFAGLGKGNVETLEPYHWALIPTANNY
ncbi:fasciclin domain-containing protein [Sphingobacterium suaedae]|uniref:Fasciclin domain-containing protein n=1 Tax=Sphingobacterium suaedae TaxID=1686402 RepID=A0ABW5KHS4_9SPHI